MTKCEIERLLHNLVIEGYLCENMELNNGIVCAYVAPGRLAEELLHRDNIQVVITILLYFNFIIEISIIKNSFSYVKNYSH
jgi:hypothetical protein